jgi:hypothetical protein
VLNILVFEAEEMTKKKLHPGAEYEVLSYMCSSWILLTLKEMWSC